MSDFLTEDPALASARQRLAERACEVLGQQSPPDWPVPSPCVGICKMDDERRYCQGCLRTLDELRAWGKLDNDGKRVVWAQIEERLI